MTRKKVNPVTEMPVTEPVAQSSVLEVVNAKTKNNVVPISTKSEPVQNDRDWSEIDAVLSNVVNFV
jgi:hypothetical protein